MSSNNLVVTIPKIVGENGTNIHVLVLALSAGVCDVISKSEIVEYITDEEP
jgi:hypothetical protein